MQLKTCKKCNDDLPLDDFHKDKAMPDSRKNICKGCRKGTKVIKKVKLLKSDATLTKDGFEMFKGHRINRIELPSGETRYVTHIKSNRKRHATVIGAKNEVSNAVIMEKQYTEKIYELTNEKRKDAFNALKIADEFHCTLLEMAEFYQRHHTAVKNETNTGMLIDLYIENQEKECERGNLRPISVDSAKSFLKNIKAEFGDMDITCIITKDLNEFLDRIETLPNRKAHRTYIASFFNYIANTTDIFNERKSPIKGMTSVTLPDENPEAYSVDDARKLFDNAPDRLRAYITLSMFCGLRPAEALRLQWSDIEFHNKRIALRGVQTKKGRVRFIDLEPNAFAVLSACKADATTDEVVITKCENFKSAKKKVERWMRVLAKEQGVRLIHSGMRHSFATYHLALHDKIDRTRRALGHKDFSILEKHYVDYASAFNSSAKQFFSIGIKRDKIVRLKTA